MASVRFDIISIGTLSRNRLWNEQQAIRTAHATCTLVRSAGRTILVDPGLPTAALVARLGERAGLSPADVDVVFLTNFRPAHRGALEAFSHAPLYLHENEIDSVRAHLSDLLEHAGDDDDDDRDPTNSDPTAAEIIGRELAILDRCKASPDQLAPGVELFPLFGYTAGTCGLLLTASLTTALIAGDAVPTQEHLLAGQVLPDAYDLNLAQESMREVYEIADVIVPGHDNLFLNPRSSGLG